MNDSNAYCFFFLCTLITEKKQCSLTFTRPASTLQSMNHSLLHTSFFLSGLTTLGVPEPFAGGEDRLISLKNHRISMYVTQRNQGNMVIVINHTFEALVQTPRALEQLVEVRPAVEHPLEGVVVRKLQQERSPRTPVSLTALLHIPAPAVRQILR